MTSNFSTKNGALTGLVVLALSGAALRLVPLQWLHPLNWDEVEFYRATAWIAEGRVPFRDFWQNHTPLGWYLFAPVAALISSPGADAVIAMRWAQILVWITVFAVMNAWMRNAGLTPFARWAAIGFALCSSLLMTPAVEYRVDTVACFFYILGLWLAQRAMRDAARWNALAAGAAFCLTGFANLRMGPLLVITVLLLRIVDTNEKQWEGVRRAHWIWGGAAATFALGLLYFAAVGALRPLYQQAWYENYLGDKFSTAIVGGFVHRLFVPFGVRVIGSDRLFELAAVDVGGIAIILLGGVGMGVALLRWRKPDDLFLIAFLQAASLMFIAAMKFIYNYHFEIVVVMALPLIAMMIERIPRKSLVAGALLLAWCVNGFAAVFRGKELDLAYQDLIMREVDRRTGPDERVWAGIPWALRREPAYRFWLLPEIARHLVRYRLARPYTLQEIVHDPPAAVVFDYNILVWIGTVQRELGPYFVRHYVPVWRNLWMPGMNARIRPASPPQEWIVPADGRYDVYTSRELARHGWFRDPLYHVTYNKPDASRFTFELPAPANDPALVWWIDGERAAPASQIVLRKGQRLAVALPRGSEPVAVFVMTGSERRLLRQPPGGATLEAETTRVTHVPRPGFRITP